MGMGTNAVETCGIAAATIACVAASMMAAAGAGSASSAVGASSDAAFEAVIEPISTDVSASMIGVSWQSGCPVPIADLRLITMDHWGFDGRPHRGELVVHEGVAHDVVTVFGRLFDARFPIMRMERIEHYDGDDEASMAADNTSAFNCRPITGGSTYSVHSWGMAIDINPVENPYVRDGVVLPPAGDAYLDRGDVRPGMIVEGDVVVDAFAAIGFTWGGTWDRLNDYQHFETDPSGRTSVSASACPSYVENRRQYPVELCQYGPAVESVQAQLVRRGYDIEVDGYFGPATEEAVRRFQFDEGLEADGLVGPITWPALLEDAPIGGADDEDGNGTVEPWEVQTSQEDRGCSDPPPTSDTWSGVDDIIDPASGRLDVAPFNEYLRTIGPPVATSPCDAARVLFRLDRPRVDGETIRVVVEPSHGPATIVTVTIEHLADDSVAAERVVLEFEDHGDGTVELAAGTWSQRCQPGRGHDDEFSAELCV